eukprot:CAMPEP_0116123160 /NCGR_PEP_ID=MMETSP0329-20121206/4600_1 /TAXON_ID=697910 /ORGANISM="Pseudo-nitzschia arenysensis, Strain B593" /LENGTH=584 /DNA_ID=CAMNT_0003617057 /DNA_START=218 /DNA_END=1972 /DNA_ORIENTATION=-
MMFTNRLLLCGILVSHATAIDRTLIAPLGESKVAENPRPLRGGRSNGKETTTSLENEKPRLKNEDRVRTLSFDPQADERGVNHIMIGCKDGEGEFACKKRISNAIPEESQGEFRLINYLQLTNSYSCEVKGDMFIVDALSDDVYDDPPRETLHIKESIQVHRNLQSGQSTPYGINMIKAMDVWEKYNKGENVRVCVMDTGVNRDHPDFDSNRLFGYEGDSLVKPWWRDVDGHGTHVSGTIAASDNNQGVVGVAPGAEIFTARVFSTNGQFYSSNIITALQACKDGGAQIVSMSLGGPYAVQYEMQAYADLHEKFGIITVAASGNTGGTDFLYPASYDNVISVGSVNWNYDRSSFSTKNSKVDVAAPGSSILSTWENGGYATVSGTSMACPHVSGVVALMLSANPSATPAQIFAALESSSENPNTNGRDNDMGHGIVNALAAVEEILSINDSNGNGGGNTGNNNGSSSNNNDGNNSSGSGNNNAGSNNSDCVELVITLRTDRYASDTYHWLQEGNQYVFYDNNFSSFQTYQETACINPLVCSEYNIRDSFGDGISGEGVEIKYDGEVVYQGGDFGVGGVKYLGTC